MTTFTPGGRYWRELSYQFTHPLLTRTIESTGDVGPESVALLAEQFKSPETRRMIMEARQADWLAQQNERPPVAGSQLRLPFDRMYLEFTEPLSPRITQPGYNDEQLLALMLLDEQSEMDVAQRPDAPTLATIKVASVAAFYRSGDRKSIASRSFTLDLSEGYGIATFKAALDPAFGEVSRWPEPVDTGKAFFARSIGNGQGDWELWVDDMARFVAWCIAFMTARGVVIVDMPLTRQQRRAQERATHRPAPWHIVTVEPVRVTRGPEGEGGGTTHSYRYDVRGHLRLGRHKLGDGTYREGVEWVRPHQRGLANSIYIPSTHTLERKHGPDA